MNKKLLFLLLFSLLILSSTLIFYRYSSKTKTPDVTLQRKEKQNNPDQEKEKEKEENKENKEEMSDFAWQLLTWKKGFLSGMICNIILLIIQHCTCAACLYKIYKVVHIFILFLGLVIFPMIFATKKYKNMSYWKCFSISWVYFAISFVTVSCIFSLLFRSNSK